MFIKKWIGWNLIRLTKRQSLIDRKLESYLPLKFCFPLESCSLSRWGFEPLWSPLALLELFPLPHRILDPYQSLTPFLIEVLTPIGALYPLELYPLFEPSLPIITFSPPVSFPSFLIFDFIQVQVLNKNFIPHIKRTQTVHFDLRIDSFTLLWNRSTV